MSGQRVLARFTKNRVYDPFIYQTNPVRRVESKY